MNSTKYCDSYWDQCTGGEFNFGRCPGWLRKSLFSWSLKYHTKCIIQEKNIHVKYIKLEVWGLPCCSYKGIGGLALFGLLKF